MVISNFILETVMDVLLSSQLHMNRNKETMGRDGCETHFIMHQSMIESYSSYCASKRWLRNRLQTNNGSNCSSNIHLAIKELHQQGSWRMLIYIYIYIYIYTLMIP